MTAAWQDRQAFAHARVARGEDPGEEWWTALARTVAVDFDGVLHPYSKGWTGSEPDDEPPIPGAEAFLTGLLADGFEVVIFSTRADHDGGRLGILNWLGKHMPDVYRYLGGWEGKSLHVTHVKPAAIAYVDDRAVPFTGSWDQARFGVDKLAAGRAHGAGQPPADPPPDAGERCERGEVCGVEHDTGSAHGVHAYGSVVEQVHRLITTDQGVSPWVLAEEIVKGVTKLAPAT